jgi:hypothetical protein
MADLDEIWTEQLQKTDGASESREPAVSEGGAEKPHEPGAPRPAAANIRGAYVLSSYCRAGARRHDQLGLPGLQ